MNGSLIAADRATHLKIVLLALAATIVMLLVATNAASTTAPSISTANAKAAKTLLVRSGQPPRA